MNPRVCICCGEPIPEMGNAFSRNPNMCASCSSLVDGWPEASQPEPPATGQETVPARSRVDPNRQALSSIGGPGAARHVLLT